MEEVIGDAQLSVRIPLQALPLTPSHMSLTQVGDHVHTWTRG